MRKLISQLKRKGLSLATAESCTAGYLSYLITKTPGSSTVFKGGVIVYSLEAKNRFFRIPRALLKRTQGVSPEVAVLLARRVRTILSADIGAAVVGFAGPGGAKRGLVFVAVCDKKETKVKRVIIKGSRDRVRKKASAQLLDLICGHLSR